MIIRSHLRLMALFLLLWVAGGCAGPSHGFNLVYFSADGNTYQSPSLVYERISHDSSAWPVVEYFRWLHGPESNMPAPSEYAAVGQQHLVPQPPSTSVPPGKTSGEQSPVRILVPRELAPLPNQKPDGSHDDASPDFEEAETDAGWTSTAQNSQQQTIQPTSYKRGASLPGSRMLFARP